MFKKPLKIIGINPGMRYLGIAIFQDSELLDWRIKTLKGKWSPEKMKKTLSIISEFVERYEPNILAIKKLHSSRRSQYLARLVTKIKEISSRNGLKIYQYSIKNLEEFFVQDEKLNKKNLAEAVISEYPILSHELNREKNHKNVYHIRMFEAVALGAVCFYQLDKC
jgi:Holliday junction resolvasome RuvABC endonuclease subunit